MFRLSFSIECVYSLNVYIIIIFRFYFPDHIKDMGLFFFFEGPKIIFRVVIALFSLNRGSVYRASCMPDIVYTFKEFTKDPAVLNCHKFMQVFCF